MQPQNFDATVPQNVVLPHLTRQLMQLMDEMTVLLEHEIELVRRHATAELTAVLRRKQELTMDYEAALKSLADNYKSMPADERAQLKVKGKAMDEAARRNAEVVATAHNATERLLQVVMNEIRQDLMKNSGYAPSGYLAMASKSVSQPVAISQKA